MNTVEAFFLGLITGWLVCLIVLSVWFWWSKNTTRKGG